MRSSPLIRPTLFLRLMLFVLIVPAFAVPGRAATPAEAPEVPPTVVRIEHGQPDREVVALLPDLDLQSITEPEPEAPPPMLATTPVPADGMGRLFAEPPVAAAKVVESPALPDTLLLHSGDWFGEKLRQAVAAMGLELTPRQIAELEAVAAATSVNTRMLLAAALVKRADKQFAGEDWLKWVYLEAARIRMALGPFDPGQAETMRFADGQRAALDAAMSTSARGLVTIFGAGRTTTETTAAIAEFENTYDRFFGDPDVDEAMETARAPFLHLPYRVPLTGIAYFDHTYPTVDFYKTPNVPGMLNYLGQTNVNYDAHDGDDFWMPYGSDVYAPVSGPVLWVDPQAVLIGYEANTYHIYIGHLSQRFANVGDYVTRGQIIGRSGIATVPHIHFEVRHNGKQTDTKGWYGGGSDPCTSAGPIGNYRGCEESTWLWVDLAPPFTQLVEGLTPQVLLPLVARK